MRVQHGGRSGLAFTVLLAGIFQAAPEAFQGAGHIPDNTFTTQLMGRGPYLFQLLENTATIQLETYLLVGMSSSLETRHTCNLAGHHVDCKLSAYSPWSQEALQRRWRMSDPVQLPLGAAGLWREPLARNQESPALSRLCHLPRGQEDTTGTSTAQLRTWHMASWPEN